MIISTTAVVVNTTMGKLDPCDTSLLLLGVDQYLLLNYSNTAYIIIIVSWGTHMPLTVQSRNNSSILKLAFF
jgi:hypothetical protein